MRLHRRTLVGVKKLGEKRSQVLVIEAHLAVVIAAKTLVPVLAVPIASTPLNGLDSLLAMVQMPKGVPVATLAIGKPGAANAALFAAEILALNDKELYVRLSAWRAARAMEVLEQTLP